MRVDGEERRRRGERNELVSRWIFFDVRCLVYRAGAACLSVSGGKHSHSKRIQEHSGRQLEVFQISS